MLSLSWIIKAYVFSRKVWSFPMQGRQMGVSQALVMIVFQIVALFIPVTHWKTRLEKVRMKQET